MEKLSDEARRRLSGPSAEYYEAELFAEMHPEYYKCPANSAKMIAFLTKRGMPCNLDSLNKAYAALTKTGELMPGMLALEKMSADELLELSERVGEPVHDFAGRIIGYELPRALATNTTGKKFEAAVRGGEEYEFNEFCKQNNFPQD